LSETEKKIAEVAAAVKELSDGFEIFKDEVSDALDAMQKQLSTQIAEADGFMRKTIEPNQHTINESVDVVNNNVLKVYEAVTKKPVEANEE
jgi:hypothetical protein